VSRRDPILLVQARFFGHEVWGVHHELAVPQDLQGAARREIELDCAAVADSRSIFKITLGMSEDMGYA
jgi:hypothetical protein